MDYVPLIAQFAWPLVLLFVGVMVANRLSRDMRPIFVNIVGGVAKQAGSNASAYAIAIMFGLSASLSAFVDVFKDITPDKFHELGFLQFLALCAKVLNPFIVAVLAYATQNKFNGGGLGGTKPPFPEPQPPTT